MNQKKQKRLAIIGCGAIAEIFHLPALVANKQTRSGFMLVDANRERALRLGDQFGVNGVLADYRELDPQQLDGVIVATPPSTHFDICKWCIQNGLHVLCEKPLTEHADEAVALVEMARDHNVTLAVNQTRRFFPTYQRIREVIESGRLGQLESIEYLEGFEFDWPAAGQHHFMQGAKGAWSDTGVHLLDTIIYWLGAKPELVSSLNDSAGGPEALAEVQLQHEQCRIRLKVSRLGKLPNQFVIRGQAGELTAENEEWRTLKIEYKSGRQERLRCSSRHWKYTDFAHGLLNNFLTAMDGSARPLAGGEDVVPAIELLEEAYQQAQSFHCGWNTTVKCLDRIDGDLPRPKRVLVTGANGFVGGRLIEMMARSGFSEPVGLVRQWTRAAKPARFPIEIRVGDITDSAAISAAVADVDAIVHCAKTDDRDSIVGGTRQLLAAAEQHGISRFIFLSTAEVYGSGVSGAIDEGRKLSTDGSDYSRFKTEAEEVCQEFVKRGMAVTSLRPSLIYGPFSSSWSIDIAKRLYSGNWGTFEEHGQGLANLVYIDDLVQAILRSLVSEAAAGQAFNVNGPETPTWNEYFERFNLALGLPALSQISAGRSRLKTRVMDGISWMADQVLDRFEDQLMEIYLRGGFASRVMKYVKGELNSTPSGTELNDLFSRDAQYVDSKAQSLLGYQPEVGLDQGIAMTIEWLRRHELIPVPIDCTARSEQIDREPVHESAGELVP